MSLSTSCQHEIIDVPYFLMSVYTMVSNFADNCLSESSENVIPQGKVQGSSLLLFYINDLPKPMTLSNSIKLFAGNFKVYICRMIPILHNSTNINQIMSGAKSQKLEQQKPTSQPTKVCSVIKYDEDRKIIKEDISTIVHWSKNCKLRFNISECKGMHIESQKYKGTHTVYLSNSFYIINQKRMIPKTDFIVQSHGLHFILGKIRQCICLFS